MGTEPHMHAGPVVFPVGGKAEVPELEAKISAGIDLRMGRAVSALERLAQFYERTSVMAKFLSLAGQATADSSGNALIVMGGAQTACPQGLRWVVHQMVVGGLTWASVAGTAVAGIMPMAWNPDTQIPLASVQDGTSFTNGLPNTGFYSRGQFVVPSMNLVYLQITGGTSGTVYTASMDFVQEPAGS